MNDHNLVDGFTPKGIAVSHRAVRDRNGSPADGLHNVWITLDNPKELNSYTTQMLKELILALREASNDRAAVAVILTGAGTTAFCTGGNTRQYAEVYAGKPGEYRQYMRLFNDAVTGADHQAAKELMALGTIDLTLLDDAIDELTTKLLYTMPDCLTKTIESLRKHKLEHWDRNRETNRAWLSLNMMTEANAGFRAFHHGTKERREVDFILLRRRLAEGAAWGEELINEIAPWTKREELVES